MIKKIKDKLTDINDISEKINYSDSMTVSFLNPFSYSILRVNEKLYLDIDYFCTDGILLNKFVNLFLNMDLKRSSFDMTSLAPEVFQDCIKNNKTIYFVGSKPGEINNSINIITKSYPKLNIMGFRNGYFNSNIERNHEIKRIAELKPDFVVIGMGTPLQEEFLIDLKNEGWIGIGFTCGGFLHQTQKELHYYPKIVDKLNLRMPYRLFKERLFSRLKMYPIFIKNFFKDIRN